MEMFGTVFECVEKWLDSDKNKNIIQQKHTNKQTKRPNGKMGRRPK